MKSPNGFEHFSQGLRDLDEGSMCSRVGGPEG